MTSNDPKLSDISSLINQASNEVGKTNSSSATQAKESRPLPWGTLFPIVLVSIALYAGYNVWQNASPPPKEQVARDLDVVLEKAHKSIEEAKAKNGTLPEALPNAALASVVDYEVRDKEYQLTTSMLGVRITLQRDGKKTTETVAR